MGECALTQPSPGGEGGIFPLPSGEGGRRPGEGLSLESRPNGDWLRGETSCRKSPEPVRPGACPPSADALREDGDRHRRNTLVPDAMTCRRRSQSPFRSAGSALSSPRSSTRNSVISIEGPYRGLSGARNGPHDGPYKKHWLGDAKHVRFLPPRWSSDRSLGQALTVRDRTFHDH